MDKSRSEGVQFFKIIIGVFKWARRLLFIIVAALMIGFTNAFYDEGKWINDTQNINEQEQVIDEEEP